MDQLGTQMHPLIELHNTLQAAGMLLDSAAGQVRDAKLLPAKQHIQKIGEALATIFEIQRAIHVQAPELRLEKRYEETSEEVRQANRRLGEAMLAADSIADAGDLKRARDHLSAFAARESSEYHANLARLQMDRYADDDAHNQGN